MIARNISELDLYEALALTNVSFRDNVIWNRKPDRVGKRYRFTLKVKSSLMRGAGKSPTHIRHDGGRYRLATACWHVHGLFFNHLITINKKAIIETTYGAGTISIEGGNWVDYPRGNIANSIMASKLCDCDVIY